LKVNLCHENGWFAEGEISYAGPRAEARARLAGDILRERLPLLSLRVDLIGVSSIWADDAGPVWAALPDACHTDVRLRIAASHEDKAVAEQLFVAKCRILNDALRIDDQDDVGRRCNQSGNRIGVQSVEKTLRLIKTPRLLSRCSFERLGHKYSI
jgi:hypothetical protein